MKKLTEKDIEEGKELTEIFYKLNSIEKAMTTAYMSALRDKQVMEGKNKPA